jgi:hypothetical protein
MQDKNVAELTGCTGFTGMYRYNPRPMALLGSAPPMMIGRLQIFSMCLYFIEGTDAIHVTVQNDTRLLRNVDHFPRPLQKPLKDFRTGIKRALSDEMDMDARTNHLK